MPEDLFKQLVEARRAHRHAAHVYAHIKNTPANRPKYEEAVEALEKAATVFVLAAAAFGQTQSPAPPCLTVRKEWERSVDPEPARQRAR